MPSGPTGLAVSGRISDRSHSRPGRGQARCERTGTGIQGNVIAEDCRNVEALNGWVKRSNSSSAPFTVPRMCNRSRRYAALRFQPDLSPESGLTVDLHQRIVEIRCNRDCGFAGRVHGVVVQITSEIGPLRCLRQILLSVHPDRPPEKQRDGRRSFVVILNFRFRQRRTESTHQCTGFAPLCR